MVIMSEDKFYSFIVTLKEDDVKKDVRVGFVTPTTTKFGNFKDQLAYNLPS